MIPLEIRFESESSELQDKYREFFKGKLKEFGVSSPSQLSSEQKTEFFNSIKEEWAKEKKDSEASPYKKYFRTVLEKYGVNSPAEIPEDKRDDFFEEVDQGWDAGDNETD